MEENIDKNWPQGQFLTQGQFLIVSKEGKTFKLDSSIIETSQYLTTLVEELGIENIGTIQVSFSTFVLEKMFQFLDLVQRHGEFKQDSKLLKSPHLGQVFPKPYADWIQQVCSDWKHAPSEFEMLVELATAAEYFLLLQPLLIDLVTAQIVSRIKLASGEETRFYLLGNKNVQAFNSSEQQKRSTPMI